MILAILRGREQWNSLKCSVKTREDRKREEVKIKKRTKYNEQKIFINGIDIDTTISIMILNMNSQNKTIRRRIQSTLKQTNKP